jgi:cell division protein FtsZ
VNITASESLELGEFADVGDTIEEFASDNATVVVGTVIDESLGDEIKVTVVATGLGAEEMAAINASANTQISRPQKTIESSHDVKPTVNTHHEANDVPQSTDYSSYDQPTVMRQKRLNPVVGNNAAALASKDDDLDLLDIPAFLRRQAD